MTASAFAPGWTFIASQDAAVSANINFTQFNSEYAAYKVVIANYKPATDAVNLIMRTSSNGGVSYDAGASDYAYGALETAMAAATIDPSIVSDESASEIVLAVSVGNAANELASIEITIFKPSAATPCSATWAGYFKDDAGIYQSVSGSGVRVAAADVDAIRFLASSGNITSGTFTLYGLRAS